MIALAASAATVGTLGTGPEAAGASLPTPRVTVRVRHRTLFVDGGRASELITLRSPAATPHLVAVDLGDDGTADARIHRNRFDEIVVRSGDGNDIVRIDEAAGVAVPFSDTVPTLIRGQAGDDTLLGGSGAEVLRGGRGSDLVDGNLGNDSATLGRDDDQFVWDPGDGSDVVDGGDGHDMMTFNGSAGNETFNAIANGSRLRFTRNVGNIVMDTDDVEQVDINTLGGSDFVEIDDLASTDVTSMQVDEGGTPDDDTPDGVVDNVNISGTTRSDAIGVSGSAGAFTVSGLVPTLTVADVEPFDRLLVSSLGGRDVVDASALGADTLHLDVLAGSGDDTVLGEAGSDTVLAGPGQHGLVDGNRGGDSASLDGGDDEFVWDPGDGSDIIEGDRGHDVMTFNGSGDSEVFAAMAVGQRLAFTRDLGNIRMDTDDVEQVDVNALGGDDHLTVGDLTGTDVTAFANLGGALGAVGGDGQVDAMTVFGTPDDDAVSVSGAIGAVRVTGLVNTVDISNAEPTDTLAIIGNGGDDSVDSTGLAPGTIGLSVN